MATRAAIANCTRLIHVNVTAGRERDNP